MARSSPQSFEKRQRERRKQQRREEKLERRLIRNEEKRRAKAEREGQPVDPQDTREEKDAGEDSSPDR